MARSAPTGDYNFGDYGAEPRAKRGGGTFYDADNLTQEQALAELAKLTVEDTVDPHIRRAAIKIVRDCEARDDVCELTALFKAVKHGDPQVKGLEKGLKYVADPVYRDFYVRPSRALAECEDGACAGDCLPLDTLVLRSDYRLVPIGEINEGERIFDGRAWTSVTKFWDKGEQPIIELQLNNGCVLRCTPEHRVFRVPHNRLGYAGPRNMAEELVAGEIKVGDDLLTAEVVPFGNESLDADRAWLLGAFIADGWTEYSDGKPTRVALSGRDGGLKEAQKQRAKAIIEAWGGHVQWDARYIRTSHAPAVAFLSAVGRRAPEKHVPGGLNYDEPTVRAILSGLRADASGTEAEFSVETDRSLVHGTTSPLLASQLRVMYRMLGRSSSIKRVDNHGGLGENPIYRVTVRQSDEMINPRERKPHARVVGIREASGEATCDIETASHRFYLPETDLIVHNCDDHAMLIAALAGTLGFSVGLRAYKRKGGGSFEHVYAVAGIPKGQNTHVFGLDTSADAGASEAGWEPPEGDVLTAWLEGEG